MYLLNLSPPNSPSHLHYIFSDYLLLFKKISIGRKKYLS